MNSSTKAVGWGILGAGRISRQFASAVAALEGSRIAAVGARSLDSSRRFAEEFSIPKAYGNYSDLVNDPTVDVVYIGTLHPSHAENSLLALEAGKAVLCEKPFAMNASEAESVIQAARARGLFVMEAMWTRFFPLMGALKEMLRSGAIGEPRMLTADFGYRAEHEAEPRAFQPALGGGALLDVGVYPVSLASYLFGPTRQSASLANLGKTGVDEEAAILLSHDAGRLSVLTTANRLDTPHEVRILGSEGMIRIHPPWWKPSVLTLSRSGQPKEETREFPYQGNGYQFEAMEVVRCLRGGLKESPVMPLEETLSIMKTLDSLRHAWGLRYPSDKTL